MTADPLAYLHAAHEEAEARALATTPVPVPCEWAAVRDKHAGADAPLALIQGRDEYDPDPDRGDYSYGNPVIALSAEWQDEAEVNLRHIAANSPAAVLGRIAADRRILERHVPFENLEIVDMPKVGRVTRCRHDKERWPCSDITDLAEGWGWEDEDL